MEKIVKIFNNAKFKNIMSWIMTFVVALVLALFINIILIRISVVDGPSMEKTYFSGNTVLVSKVPYLFGFNPKHSDVIVIDSETKKDRNIWTDVKDSFKYNLITNKLLNIQSKKFWIKRVIGVAGDVIELKGGNVYRNGELLDEPYVNPDITPNYVNTTYVVDKDCVFVMGDNRTDSTDSRVIGMVPLDHVLGKVLKK